MFIVLETQTNTDGKIGTLVTSFDNEDEAQSKYHAVLSSAAISKLPRHACFLLRDDAYVVESKCFRHDVEGEASDDN